MDHIRFYCETLRLGQVELGPDESRHLASVRRLGVDEVVQLFDGKGALATAKVLRASKKRILLQIDQLQHHEQRKTERIVLCVSVAKGERFDWLVAKATEMGVDAIFPVIFERTVKQASNSKVVNRWMRIAVNSAKQSRRLFLPRIEMPQAFLDVCSAVNKEYPNAILLAGNLKPDAASIQQLNIMCQDIVVFVGPEGGFADSEIQKLQAAGAIQARLTNTVLRTETAGVAFAAILAAMRDSPNDNIG